MKIEYTTRIVSSQQNLLLLGVNKAIGNKSPSETVILHEQQAKPECG